MLKSLSWISEVKSLMEWCPQRLHQQLHIPTHHDFALDCSFLRDYTYFSGRPSTNGGHYNHNVGLVRRF